MVVAGLMGASLTNLKNSIIPLVSGEPSVGAAPVIHFPGYTLEDGIYVQYSPVRTISVLSAIAANLLFSYLASALFNKGLFPEKWDVCRVEDQSSARTPTPADHNRRTEREGNTR